MLLSITVNQMISTCHLEIRKYSFAHRIVDIWNSLDSIVACDSINGFKGNIDRFLYGGGFI